MKILLIDFGYHRCQTLRARLQAEGHLVYLYSAVPADPNSFEKVSSDTVGWDIMLVCGENSSNKFIDKAVYLRSICPAPLIAVLQNANAHAMTRLLNQGVDDGVRGNIAFDELLIRLQKLHKRSADFIFQNKVLRVGDIRVHLTKKEVSIGSTVIPFTKTEYRIFLYLVFHAHDLVKKRELQFHAFKQCSLNSHTLNMHISRIRKKFESLEPAIQIKTISTAGFMLVAGNDNIVV